MTFTVAFEIPGLPPSPNDKPAHFQTAARDRKTWRTMTHRAALQVGRPPRPLIDVELIITRHSAVAMDLDNRVSAAKPCRDALRDAGIILDDSDKILLKQDYPQGKARPGKGFMSIQVKGTVMTEEAWNVYLEHQKELAIKRLNRAKKRQGIQISAAPHYKKGK